MKITELLDFGKQALKAAGIEEYQTDAWLLLSFVTGVSRASYYAHPEQEAGPEREQEYRRVISLRAGRLPLQHITRQACFMGYDFYVDEHVLIPRQDTEILAEEALRRIRGIKAPRILDLCTGSGCILTSLLLERTDASGTGTDISAEALAVAGRNAEALGTADRSLFLESDLFSAPFFRGENGEKDSHEPPEYDILVSNPPYIRTEEIKDLQEEVRLHDPLIALDGKEDGLFFYREITRNAMPYLREGGWLLFEIGYDQGRDVAGLLQSAGFCDVSVKKDLAGMDRVAEGRKPFCKEER